MHCELVVPALLPDGDSPRPAAGPTRFPALELLLARGRFAQDEPTTLERWLFQAFGFDADELPAGAVTVLADGGEPGKEVWLRADPVHLKLNRDHLVLIPSAAFEVSREEAEAMCETLNAHFAGALAFHPLHPERWCVRVAGMPVALRTTTPLEAAGKDADAQLPRGDDGKRWHALANEIQMLLHDHPVNEARERRAAPGLNSVWLWGAGQLPSEAQGPWQSVSSNEPLALGLARLAGMRYRPLPQNAEEWLSRAPEDGRHLLVLDQLRAAQALEDAEALSSGLAKLEERWFKPLLDALRRDRIGMLTICTLDGSYETVRGDLRRFWRRPKPLANYAA